MLYTCIQEDSVIYNFTIDIIPCSLSGRFCETGYRLCDNTILLPSERDADGNYYGGVGIQGMFLRTGMVYHPVYDKHLCLKGFRRKDSVTA